MGSIIDKLMEIETIASRIRESVSFKKQELLANMEDARRVYDKELEAETKEKIELSRKELQDSYKADVDAIWKDADRMSADMDNYFKQHHSTMADEIYEKIIGM